MDLSDFVSTPFTFVDADWRAGESSELFQTLRPLAQQPTHVLVERDEDDEEKYHYVFRIEDVAQQLGSVPNDLSVKDALNLHERKATPVIDIATPLEAAPDVAIVQDHGQVVGVYDVNTAFLVAGNKGGWGGWAARRSATDPVAAPSRVERTVVATLPDTIVQDETVSLLVELTAPKLADLGIDVALPAGSQVHVIVQARRGLAVEGRFEGDLTLLPDEDTLPLRFNVRAVDLGPAELRVLAFHDGLPLGALTLTTIVVPMGGATGTGRPVTREHGVAPTSLRLPDLQMLVLEQTQGSRTQFEIRLTSPNSALGLNYKRFGPVALRSDAAAFFREFFDQIENLPTETPDERAAVERAVAERGSYLFQELFPAELRQLVWSLRNSIRSVVIQSEEPWIPWELCKMFGEENGRIVEGPFFSESFAVSRWVPELRFKEPLTLKNMALVVPGDSGLPMAVEERDYVLSLTGADRRVTAVPARPSELQAGFASGDFDVWHFTGHGLADENVDSSSIVLENGQEFQPRSLTGTALNLGRGNPLVFFNACQVGRSGVALTGAGGWAHRFIQAGAAAFVGTYWSVSDAPACRFAKEVYSRLVTGIPIGIAVKEARAAIRTPDDPTWLAYTLFANPLAAVEG